MPDSEIIFLIEESPEGGYETRALGYSIFTQADSFDQLRDVARDAVRCHFEERTRPQVFRLLQGLRDLMDRHG